MRFDNFGKCSHPQNILMILYHFQFLLFIIFHLIVAPNVIHPAERVLDHLKHNAWLANQDCYIMKAHVWVLVQPTFGPTRNDASVFHVHQDVPAANRLACVRIAQKAGMLIKRENVGRMELKNVNRVIELCFI